MFYDENGIPLLDKPIEDEKEFLDIREMESGGRLVENVDGFGGRTL